MTDFSDTDLASRAVAFYDNPQQFETFLDTVNQEAPWSADERLPTPAELAFEIFFNLLIENNYLGYIAWDAGGDEVLEGSDRLFSTAGLSPSSRAASAKRLHAFAPVAGSAGILF